MTNCQVVRFTADLAHLLAFPLGWISADLDASMGHQPNMSDKGWFYLSHQ